MAETPRREIATAWIVSKLEAIIADDGTLYHNGGRLVSVQRYKNIFGTSEEGLAQEVTQRGDTPTIIVRDLSEEGDTGDTVDTITNTLTLQIEWVTRGIVTSTDLNNALADMIRAIMAGFGSENGFGVGAVRLHFSNRMIDPETGMPADGIFLILSFQYQNSIGDPALPG